MICESPLPHPFRKLAWIRANSQGTGICYGHLFVKVLWGGGGVTVSGTYSRGLFRESGGVGIKMGTGGYGDSVSWHAFGVDPWPSALR